MYEQEAIPAAGGHMPKHKMWMQKMKEEAGLEEEPLGKSRIVMGSPPSGGRQAKKQRRASLNSLQMSTPSTSPPQVEDTESLR